MFNIDKALIPRPQQMMSSGESVELARFAQSDFSFICDYPDDAVCLEAFRLVSDAFIAKSAAVSNPEADYTIVLRVNACDKRLSAIEKPESYVIDITGEKAELCGADPSGLFYAATTFVRLIHGEDSRSVLPLCTIIDYPDFSDRGQFIENRFGSDFMTKEDWFAAIDYFAEMKLNQITIGVYGCWCVQYDNRISEFLYLPIKKYPQLQTPRDIKYYSVEQRKWIYRHDVLPVMFTDDYLGEVIAYAKKKNIIVKPLFNSLGHNTLIPRLIPEISARNENGEPTGHYFCTSDENTYRVMYDIYDEIIDRYLKPNGITAIEIGLDEVYAGYGESEKDVFTQFSPRCMCEKCRGKEFPDLMIEYIIKICRYLKSKGMKSIYIYHDMLMHHFDCINEKLAERFKEADIYDVVVLDWWSYSATPHLFRGETDKVNSCFRSIMKPFSGYYHWVLPLEFHDNINGCAKLAKEKNFEGIESYGSFDYSFDRSFLYQSDLSWNISSAENISDFYERYAYRYYPHAFEDAYKALDNMREIMIGEAAPNYAWELEYYLYTYPNPDKPYPHRFPDEAFAKILAAKDTYYHYFAKTKALAAEAISFFKGEKKQCKSPEAINNVWLTTALHYYTLCDEFESLVSDVEAFNIGKLSARGLIFELDRLITAREALMKQAEKTRIKANGYVLLRNMSVYLRSLLDMRAYIANRINSELKFKLDLTDLSEIRSEGFAFLQ